jgi:hypothetical protein
MILVCQHNGLCYCFFITLLFQQFLYITLHTKIIQVYTTDSEELIVSIVRVELYSASHSRVALENVGLQK